VSVTTTVERREADKPPTVGEMIQSLRPELQRALPRGMDADRLARVALTVVRKEKKLAACDPYSFAGALLTAAALGLEPGVADEAYLIPYGKECQFVIGYQGFAKLFWQHPLAQHLDAQAVHKGDVFDYGYGTDPYLRHKPANTDRGDITHYYAVAKLTTGGSAFVVLTADEVRQLRGGKVGSSGDIPDPMHWMERKTAIRQLVKLLPKSTKLAQAIASDERPGSELRAEQEPSKALDGATPVAELPGPQSNPDTGEVVDAEVVDPEPEDNTWPAVTPPGGKR
jgi:recombination protein RecT